MSCNFLLVCGVGCAFLRGRRGGGRREGRHVAEMCDYRSCVDVVVELYVWPSFSLSRRLARFAGLFAATCCCRALSRLGPILLLVVSIDVLFLC